MYRDVQCVPGPLLSSKFIIIHSLVVLFAGNPSLIKQPLKLFIFNSSLHILIMSKLLKGLIVLNRFINSENPSTSHVLEGAFNGPFWATFCGPRYKPEPYGLRCKPPPK